MSLEITPEQRVPGLKNPLTQEQVDWVEAKMLQELKANKTILQWTPVQEVAEALLPQGASLNDIYQAVELS